MTIQTSKLTHMAAQIAANITVSKDPEVITDKLVDHLQRFWDPRMRQEFASLAQQPDNGLDPILLAAATKLGG